MNLRDYFEARVERVAGCWLWNGMTDSHGYAIAWDGKRKVKASRVSYALHVGPIPDGLCVLHRCDNPICTNPEHLFTGTQADNMRDMKAKGRARAPLGEASKRAKLTEAEVILARQMHADGARPKTLYEKFCLGRHSMWKLLTGRSWKHVPIIPEAGRGLVSRGGQGQVTNKAQGGLA